jgi:hypothetical protein
MVMTNETRNALAAIGIIADWSLALSSPGG